MTSRPVYPGARPFNGGGLTPETCSELDSRGPTLRSKAEPPRTPSRAQSLACKALPVGPGGDGRAWPGLARRQPQPQAPGNQPGWLPSNRQTYKQANKQLLPLFLSGKRWDPLQSPWYLFRHQRRPSEKPVLSTVAGLGRAAGLCSGTQRSLSREGGGAWPSRPESRRSTLLSGPRALPGA